ncbi:hypothetical protein FKO18_01720 [Klebsiella pneumoniae]|uniref:hypothetical protein n=1 Tax=Klebsiella pneumoniae TaxID=573 RepID=UPI00136DA7A9|nr:hypothetical protein [Klebsiella pneumoniae]MCW9147311.1 hypothetical protein [Klebsiella pneumoniae]NAO12687.1 hypothetical protein [Klebsiella pneumoniae]
MLNGVSSRPHFEKSGSLKYQAIDFIEEIYYFPCLSHVGLHVNKFIFHGRFGTGNSQLNRQ